jgi:DNA-binding NtrC family response regulator
MDAKEAERSAPNRSSALAGTETILLVEDEVALRRLMQRTLERYGYTVLNAQSVSDAMALAEEHKERIELLVSDVVMPGLSGPALAQRLVRLRPTMKVLYVSGFTRHAAVDGASVSSRTAFLAKPFTPHMLATSVRQALDSRTPEIS